jgi:hypothetical protein
VAICFPFSNYMLDNFIEKLTEHLTWWRCIFSFDGCFFNCKCFIRRNN